MFGTGTRLKAGGFTLVELAIAMTIIGLLIGGVMKGTEMLNQARITATIRDYQEMSAATHAFRDRFGQMPGDMANAGQRLPGCTPENFCDFGNGNNGDGNGRVGRLPTNGMGNVAHLDQSGTDAAPKVETSLFWKHLALADLITGINPSADITNDVAAGVTHPRAAIGGAFTILYSQNYQNKRWVRGHVFRLQAAASGGQRKLGSDVIRGRDAWKIDTKIDDGYPKSGFVAATYDGLASGNVNDYLEPPHDNSKDWMMYFSLEGYNHKNPDQN